MVEVAREIAKRLESTQGKACFMVPTRGSSRYATEGNPLYDPEGDRAFLTELKSRLAPSIEVIERDTHAEDPAFVEEAVKRLISMIEEPPG